MNAISLEQHITENYDGNKAEFARANDVIPQQVTRWIKQDWLVIDNTLYSPKRELSSTKNSRSQS